MSELKGLLPCPFCGEKHIAFDAGLYDQLIFAACGKCKTTGPHCKTRTEAIEAWNQRNKAPQIETLVETAKKYMETGDFDSGIKLRKLIQDYEAEQ